MDADDLIDRDRFHVSPPLWFIGRPDEPGSMAKVDAVRMDGTEASAALLFTRQDLAEQCLAEHFEGEWALGELIGRQDALGYLDMAQSCGLAFVAFDPGRTHVLYPIEDIVGQLMENE